MISLTTFLIGAGISILIWIFFKNDGKKHPPGPLGIPILGNLVQMGSLPHLKLSEWVPIYGNIFQVKFGMQRLIVLSDVKLAKEAFNDINLSGRFDLEASQLLPQGPHGIINSEGSEWSEQRRFCLRQLRDLGFGKQSQEGVIMDELNECLSFLKSNEGQDIKIDKRFNISILNILWAILSQQRVSHDDKKFVDIFDRQKQVLEDMSRKLSLFAPRIAKLFPKASGWNDLVKLVGDMRQIFETHIQEHKNTFQDDDNPRDFIDVYLKEIKQTTDPNSSFYRQNGERSLKAVCGDLFVAGPDTTSSSISWSFLYLTKFPLEQKKIQQEIDRVVGKNRQVSLNDRPNLPYTEAAIQEVLRMSSIVPLGVFHRALTDVNFHGYDIIKGDWLCVNQYHLHYHKNIWKDPQVFDPSRHLVDGIVKKHEALNAFGIGNRYCIGERLARDVLFLFLGNIFQKFQVSLANESVNVSLDAKPNFVLPPQDFKVIVKER